MSISPAISYDQVAEFLLLAGHGLRSPITAMRWGLEILHRSEHGEVHINEKEMLAELHRSAKEMSAILGSMSLLSQIQQEKNTPEIMPFSVHTVLQNIQSDYQSWADVRYVTCEIHCSKDLLVTADMHIWQSVLQHVFSLCIDTARHKTPLHIDAVQKDNAVHFSFTSDCLELSDLYENVQHIVVGGTPGLLLFLARNLAHSIGGTVELMYIDESTVEGVSVVFPV